MSNLFVNLPMPVLNGAGAAQDVSGMGATKTFIASGSFEGCTITVEASSDGGTQFSPVLAFQSGTGRREVPWAATHMRVNVAGRVSGLPFSANVDVGCNDGGTLHAALALPVLNGAGAPTDVSTLGTFNTIMVSGTFPRAAVLIEASEDGVDYAPVCQFSGQGGSWSGLVTANWMRTRVSGRVSGAVFTNVSAATCAANDPVTGGSGTAGGDRGWYGNAVDGDYVSAGDDTATRDMYFGDMTISAGDTYSTNGYKIAVAGTLTIGVGGFLDNSGADGIDGGAGAPEGTLLGGGAGGAGNIGEIPTNGNPGTSTSWWPVAAAAGGGGAGGMATAATGGAGGTAALGYGAGPYTIEQIACGDGVGGGAGGGSGGANANPSTRGKGGGGGGVMVIKARYLSVPDDAIRCRGGAGMDGVLAGGGGGGQGGVVLIITDEPAAPVCDVSGGVGGAGLHAGIDGDDGVVSAISPVHGPL